MEIGYTDEALKDISYWKKSGDKIIQNKIQKLIISIQENPTEGIGKPEKLKHNLS
ncbi:type II toxin-antitoxin system YoeB family toxin, partial [Flavobacterium psychrophilum]